MSKDGRFIQWTFEVGHFYLYGEDPDSNKKEAKTVKTFMLSHCRIKNSSVEITNVFSVTNCFRGLSVLIMEIFL